MNIKIKKPDAIICDLDGTLCDAINRRQYVEGKDKNFDKFYAEAKNDKPNKWCKFILESIPRSVSIIIVTGRPEKWMTEAGEWMDRFNIRFNEFYARKDGDFRQDFIIKQEIYETHIKDKYNVLFCLDDRKQVTDMWRRNGLICLQCDDGNF